MFQHLSKTDYPPRAKPLLVYDGKCGFCKYWVIKWKLRTKDSIEYQPLQEAASQFKDIPETHFKEALRCILPSGDVLSGPGAAYYTYYFQNKKNWLYRLYQKNRAFKSINDFAYQWIADHRDFVFRLCIRILGKDPRKTNRSRLVLAIFSFVLLLALASVGLANTAALLLP